MLSRAECILRLSCAQVQTLFWADGDGLPRPEIAQLCSQLLALLDVMGLETANLISNYEQVRSARHFRCEAGWVREHTLGSRSILFAGDFKAKLWSTGSCGHLLSCSNRRP